MTVAREHHKRGLPMDVIVIDFHHWDKMGDWEFDPRDWSDPTAMVQEIENMGIKVMVSIWPTIDTESKNYCPMFDRGLLIRNENGFDEMQRYIYRNVESEHVHDITSPKRIRSYVAFYDATHPEARTFLWENVKKNYYAHGIKIFWLDCNEPELKHLDYHNIRYYLGNGEEVTSLYPNMHAKMIFDGMKAAGEKDIVSLSRSGWAGIQKYGTVLWSGDIDSDFKTLREQVTVGLNVAMSGVPWWNTDIGGFVLRGDGKKIDRETQSYQELLVRWFQYGCFCPVMRMHGSRSPNEIWTYGEKAYAIMKKYLFLREGLKPYILEQMKIAHETGIVPMRPLFVDFPDDNRTYTIKDQYMFGSDILVAPILYEKARSRKIYLPDSNVWIHAYKGNEYRGNQWVKVDAPLEEIPIFIRGQNKEIEKLFTDCFS